MSGSSSQTSVPGQADQTSRSRVHSTLEYEILNKGTEDKIRREWVEQTYRRGGESMTEYAPEGGGGASGSSDAGRTRVGEYQTAGGGAGALAETGWATDPQGTPQVTFRATKDGHRCRNSDCNGAQKQLLKLLKSAIKLRLFRVQGAVQTNCNTLQITDLRRYPNVPDFAPTARSDCICDRSRTVTIVEFLKEENKILRSRVPCLIHTKHPERDRRLKLGKPLGRAIEGLLTIVALIMV